MIQVFRLVLSSPSLTPITTDEVCHRVSTLGATKVEEIKNICLDEEDNQAAHAENARLREENANLKDKLEENLKNYAQQLRDMTAQRDILKLESDSSHKRAEHLRARLEGITRFSSDVLLNVINGCREGLE